MDRETGFQIWNVSSVHREKRLFLSVYVDDINFAGKKQNLDPMWKVLSKEGRFGRTNIFLGSCILALHSTKMRNKQRYCGQLQNHVRIADFCWGIQRNYHSLNIFVFLHGLMTWLVMQRSVWNDIVSWQTRRLSNSTKYLLHALMTTTSKKKKLNLLVNCQIHALNLSCNAYTWQELDDLIFYGQ